MKKLFAASFRALRSPWFLRARAAKKHTHSPTHHKTTVLKGSFRPWGPTAPTPQEVRQGAARRQPQARQAQRPPRHLAPKHDYTFACTACPRARRAAERAPRAARRRPPSRRRPSSTNKRREPERQAESKTVQGAEQKRYFVLVSDGDQAVACAKLDRKGHRRHHKKRASPGHKGRTRQRQEEARGQAQAEPRARRRATSKPSQAKARARRSLRQPGKTCGWGAAASERGGNGLPPLRVPGYPGGACTPVLSVLQVFIAVG
jgi:hypothetical protein